MGSQGRQNKCVRLTDAKSSTRNTIGDRAEPCQLGLVDGEVRAAWTLETLLVQNLLGSGGRQRVSLNTSRRPHILSVSHGQTRV